MAETVVTVNEETLMARYEMYLKIPTFHDLSPLEDYQCVLRAIHNRRLVVKC
jgi:hypothetical protein